MTLFDLNPDVSHLMLDRELPDHDRLDRRARRGPDDRAAAIAARDVVARARHALGTRLIAVGSALTVDERPLPRSAVR